MLDLQRPMVYISIESTGLDVENDRVIELAMIKVSPSGKVEFFQQDSTRINPGVPVPPAATAVHRITQDMLRGCPRFAALSKALYAFMDGCDLAGYNVRRLVVPMLTAEFQRCGMQFPAPGTKVVDVMRIFHKHERRDLAGAVVFFLNRPHKEQHGALEDAVAAVEVLAEMVVRYDLPRDVSALEAYACGDDATMDGKLQWSKSGDGRDIIVFDFGKYKGKTLKSVAASDPSYIAWMLPRFAPDVCALLEKATAGRLHEVRRPPRRKQQSASKPTAHSVSRLLAVANGLASRAAEQLTELVQQQQRRSQPAGLPSTLLQQVEELHQLADRLQQAANGGRVAAAAGAAVQGGSSCSTAGSSWGDCDASSVASTLEPGCSSNACSSSLPARQHNQHAEATNPWALSERLAGASIRGLPVISMQDALPPLRFGAGSQLVASTRPGLGNRFLFSSVPGDQAQENCHTAVFNFGVHKGKPLLEVALEHPTYLDWMCRKSVGFPAEVHQLVFEAQAAAEPWLAGWCRSLRQALPRADTIREDTT